jgi:hypothetical protein
MEEEIHRLQRTRRIPPAAQVECCVPGDELVPSPWQGEFVIFAAHFSCSFGLPVSLFFCTFLDFFALQPHHVGAYMVFVLSCFVSFCEGYASLWPSIDLWGRLFYLCPQMAGSAMAACRAT